MDSNTTAPSSYTDYPITPDTSRKISDCIGALGINREFMKSLIQWRYGVQICTELTEAQGISFLEHLKGYGG